MLKHFTYVKQSGEATDRVIYPLRLVDNDKMLGIDVSDMNEQERQSTVEALDKIHRNYLDDIYNAGFGDNFRSFFLAGMK